MSFRPNFTVLVLLKAVSDRTAHSLKPISPSELRHKSERLGQVGAPIDRYEEACSGLISVTIAVDYTQRGAR